MNFYFKKILFISSKNINYQPFFAKASKTIVLKFEYCQYWTLNANSNELSASIICKMFNI